MLAHIMSCTLSGFVSIAEFYEVKMQQHQNHFSLTCDHNVNGPFERGSK